ncbi:reverse transcriptase domain-containing protein [Tanacetum coccineum]
MGTYSSFLFMNKAVLMLSTKVVRYIIRTSPCIGVMSSWAEAFPQISSFLGVLFLLLASIVCSSYMCRLLSTLKNGRDLSAPSLSDRKGGGKGCAIFPLRAFRSASKKNFSRNPKRDSTFQPISEKSYEQVVEDAHVTLTSSQKTESSEQSSSVSSDFASKFLILDNIPPVVDEISFMMKVKNLDDLLSTRIGYATRTALQSYTKEFEKKAQEERKLYIDVVEKLVKDIIKDEVKSQLPQILPKEVSEFATPVIQSTINESLENIILVKSSSQPKSTYEATTSLTEFELKKILLDKIEKSKSYQATPKHKELYDGLVKSYNLDKDLFSSYGNVYSLKRDREDEDKDEDPPAGSNKGLKKRKTNKDAKPPKGSKSKESKLSSSKGTKPLPKSSDKACPPLKKLKGENALLYDSKRTMFIGNLPFDVKDEGLYQLFSSFKNLKDCIEAIQVCKSTQAEELVFEAADTKMQQDQRSEFGHTVDKPDGEAAPKSDWFKKPNKPSTPDRAWNDGKSIDFKPPQKWISNIAKARQPPRTPERHEYPFDLSKPLSLIEVQGFQVVPVDYFFNNNLEYLKGGSSSRNYTTSIKTKAAKYDNIEGIEDMVPMLWSPVKVAYDKYAMWGISHWGPKWKSFYGYASNKKSTYDVFSKKRIIAVTHVKVMKWYDYGYLEEIIVRRDDQKLYKFMEGDFPTSLGPKETL